MITDFQPEKQPEVNDFIYNSPKIKDSEEEFKKNEKSSAIKASAFHIYLKKNMKEVIMKMIQRMRKLKQYLIEKIILILNLRKKKIHKIRIIQNKQRKN